MLKLREEEEEEEEEVSVLGKVGDIWSDSMMVTMICLKRIRQFLTKYLTGSSFKKLEKKRLKEGTLKEDRIVKNNNTANMSETNNLI